MSKHIDPVISQCIIPLEKDAEIPKFIGTGFGVHYRDQLRVVATCRHVIEGSNVLCRSKYENGRIARRRMCEEIQEIGVSTHWVYHPNEDIDVALCPVPVDANSPDLQFSPTQFGNTDDLLEGDEVFYFGFPLGVGAELETPHHPILRTGVIAQKRNPDTFIIEANAFPGSSGSPVFFQNDPEDLKIIGILKSYIPYEDVAVSKQTGKPRVIFQENSGLANVVDVKCLNEVLSSPEWRDLADPIVEAIIEGALR